MRNSEPTQRPDWNTYFMTMAEIVASRSPDPDTQHGCIIVDAEHRVVSTGYNGPIAGIDESKVPMQRPDKYAFFIHAEDNAVLFARRDLHGCIAYVTGKPCPACLRRMLQAGIRKFYIGAVRSACISESDEQASQTMLAATNSSMVFLK